MLTKTEVKDFRPRRPHNKSRGGCLRCKQRRKKCDEARPQCTRCAGLNLHHACQYPSRSSAALEPWIQFQDPRASSSPRTSVFSPSPDPMFLFYPQQFIESGIYDGLDSMERELVCFYISHTASTLASDEADLYALQIGIPELAMQGWSLMRSILALAAVSKCHTMMANYSESSPTKTSILDLLGRAERYHGDALRCTQGDISVDGRLDMVLANAPLMVLYSSASRSVRVKVSRANASRQDEKYRDSLPPDFVSAHPDWISLVRAAHSAYSGVFGVEDQTGASERNPGNFEPRPPVLTVLKERGVVVGEDGPKSLLLPLICTTAPAALERLRATLTGTAAVTRSSTPGEHVSAHQALEVLSSIVEAMQAGNPPSLKTARLGRDSGQDTGSKVPPWLRAYLARVTMHESSSPLRRTITAFINRTPAEYVSLMMGLLASEESIQPAGMNVGGPRMANAKQAGADRRRLDGTEMVALDVLAHWLVLVLLLDDVWWLGGIGIWELGRVVALVKRQRSWDGQGDDVDWWPETMYRLARQMTQT